MGNLEVQIARTESRLAALKTKAKETAKRDDTRRKIVAGAALLKAVDDGKIRPETARALLDRFVVAPRDRALFRDGDLTIPAERNESPSPAESDPADS